MLKHHRTFSTTISILILFSFIIASTVFPSPVSADSVITVATNISSINTGDGLCSLFEAITNANVNAQTYTDCVAGSGNDTIQFNDLLGTTTLTIGSTLPNIIDTQGLTINGGGDITIDGGNVYLIFNVATSVPLSLNNLTLANGKPGISNNGVLTIDNSTLSGSSGTYGGAIENSGTLIITNSLFSANSSSGGGGSAIYNTNTVMITKSTFSNNTGTNQSRGSIYNIGTTTISNSTFSGNIITGGGCCNGAGAIYNQWVMTITNSTFSGNGTSTMGGAADIYQLGSTSILHLYNNIMANSSGEVNCRLDAGNGTVNGNNNLIESLSGCATTSPLTTNPNLGTLTGSPGYFPLNTGSPAIDAGDDTVCTASPINNTSQNGVVRPSGTHCDIGSFEKDLTQPSVSSVVRAGPDPTALASVQFTVTFSEPVTGVDAGDMGVITTGAVSGASITNVSGSGSTYTVTVNTGSGNGTLRLDIFNNLSIQDLASNSLSGGDFSSGESYTVNKGVTATLNSVAVNDGWILESTETSGKGGTLNSTATNFFLGDDLADRQYRALLHFDTSFLPDTAVITSATLKIKKQGQSGSNPFTILGNLRVDMRKPAFGTAALALTDFKSAAGQNNVSTFGVTPVANWYSAILNGTGNAYINRTGATQFRLYFTTDDNNDNGNDFMKFYSGNAGVANQPQLIIEYYIP